MTAHHHQRSDIGRRGTIGVGDRDVLRHGHGANARTFDCCHLCALGHAVDGVINLVGGVNEVLEVPVQIKSAHFFHASLEIVWTGVLELPIAEVRLQPFIAEFRAHYGGQLGQQGFPFEYAPTP